MIVQSIVLALGVLFMNGPQQDEPAKPSAELVHVSNTFRFDVRAPLARVAPLFGPEGERGWAGKHWNPEFLFPQPAKDIQGAVFRVQHGPHTSVWMNTIFDLAGGRMQYVAFIDYVVVTSVDVKLSSMDALHTAVEVTYVRTALRAEANDDVRAMGESDRASGPDWKKGVEGCLRVGAQ
jgi:hypothetical protein